MPFCLDCPDRPKCVQICPALEKTLPKELSGKNGRKERTLPPDILERIAGERAFQIRYGKGYIRRIKQEEE